MDLKHLKELHAARPFRRLRLRLADGRARSEFLLKMGLVDRVVHRANLRTEIARVIDYAGK